MSDEKEWFDFIEAKIKAFESQATAISTQLDETMKQVDEMVAEYASVMRSIKAPKLRQEF